MLGVYPSPFFCLRNQGVVGDSFRLVVSQRGVVHLYVGHSEEEYKEANESLSLCSCSCSLLSPLCITGLIGGLGSGFTESSFEFVWVFVQHRY